METSIKFDGLTLTFNDIYVKYYSLVYNFVNVKVNKSVISEEITNDTFMKVFKNLSNFDETKSKLQTWLLTIARNTIIDYWRVNLDKGKLFSYISSFSDPETGKEFLPIPDTNDINTYMENLESMEAINKAFDKLNPKHKKVMELYIFQDLEYKEIAEQLNMPIGTVKADISRAKVVLKDGLKGLYSIKQKALELC